MHSHLKMYTHTHVGYIWETECGFISVYFFRMLDIACGDLQWMSVFLDNRTDVEYVGQDIVGDLIEHHKKRFANRKQWRFIHADAVKDPIEGVYDIILCRQVLQHLVTSDVITVLDKFSRSGSKYLYSTTFQQKFNSELNYKREYRFRYINLEIAPYNLIPPLCMHNEDDPSHYMALWKLPLTRFTN